LCSPTITATHGLLDALTSGGLGIALLAPFDNTRYFFAVTPIEVSPIGFRRFFSAWGARVMLSEFVWVWIPSITFAGLVSLWRRRTELRRTARLRSGSKDSGA